MALPFLDFRTVLETGLRSNLYSPSGRISRIVRQGRDDADATRSHTTRPIRSPNLGRQRPHDSARNRALRSHDLASEAARQYPAHRRHCDPHAQRPREVDTALCAASWGSGAVESGSHYSAAGSGGVGGECGALRPDARRSAKRGRQNTVFPPRRIGQAVACGGVWRVADAELHAYA